MNVLDRAVDFISRSREKKALKKVDFLHYKANEFLKEGKKKEAMVLISKANDISSKIKGAIQ